jgi:3-dehydroquinate dehydratase II
MDQPRLTNFKQNCSKKAQEIGLDVEFAQSNVEGELVNIIQDARKKV